MFAYLNSPIIVEVRHENLPLVQITTQSTRVGHSTCSYLFRNLSDLRTKFVLNRWFGSDDDTRVYKLILLLVSVVTLSGETRIANVSEKP